MKRNRMMLTGFMGCGKTAVGEALAYRLGYDFVDTDKLIEMSERMTVSEIFKQYGEPHFRTLEHQLTYDLTKESSIVVASGGGYILSDVVYQLASDNFTIVYIDTPFETCLARIKQNTTRPLAAAKTTEQLQALYESRKRFYEIRCDFKADGSKMLLSEITAEILEGISYLQNC